ncbi:MAG: monoamine oxidase, partial [Eubacterium sp.]|nr:monoamine oxidase [Eubacterium sp.]
VMKYIYPSYGLKGWEAETPWQELGFYGIEAPILQAPPKVRSEILRVLPRYSSQLLFWDSLNIRQMLEWRNLSQAAINLLSNLFPIGGEFLYHNFVDFVQEYFPVNFTVMYQIKGGMVKLPLAFYNSFVSKTPEKYYPGIEPGQLGNVDYRAGYAVNGIHHSANDSVAVSYRSKQSDQSAYENFDYIICAVPFSILRSFDIRPMFSSIKMQAIKEVTYGNAQKTAIYCNRRFWEEQGIIGGGSYTDLPVTTIWYTSHYEKAQSPADPGVILGSYNFNLDSVRLGNMPPENRFNKIKSNVEEVHGLKPGVLDNIVTNHKTQVWDNDPLFRGAFCYFTPEQKKLFSWPMTLPEYDNKVFFAGEHISALHRWMQGALQSGMLAANALAVSQAADSGYPVK